MSSFDALPSPDLSTSESPAPRGRIVLGWLAIALIAGGFTAVQTAGKKAITGEDARKAANLVMLEVQMRALVGGWDALVRQADVPEDKRQETRASLLEKVEAFGRGNVDQRLRTIITLGELQGPGRAREELDKLAALQKEHERTPTEDEARWTDILTRLYTDFADGRRDPSTVNPDERRALRRHFGWFGDLALHPAPPEGDPASPEREHVLAASGKTLQSLVTVGMFAILAFVIGLGGLFLLALRARRGKPISHLGPPQVHHGVYVETFAIWLGLYLALMLGSQALGRDRLPWALAGCLAMLLSLSALAWPVIRGIPWRQVRADIGLTLGRQPLLEPSLGILSYCMALPFLALGVVLTIILLQMASAPGAGPRDPFAADPSLAHPVIEQFSKGADRDWLWLFLLACVMAPVMEEIMFRGVLYRHLRDLTRTAGKMSIVLSALIVCVLFAVVHPQGLLAVPMLTALACGFVLAREWRDTLIPAILAHGLNNSLILAALLGMAQ